MIDGTLAPASSSGLPFATAEQMAAVDRAMFDECGLDVLQVMETAGRMVAVMARQLLGGEVVEKRIVAVCGSGGNGGDGMVAARHLHGWGGRVTILVSRYPDMGSPAAHQLGIAQKLSMPVMVDLEAETSAIDGDLVIDGLLGFGSKGAPTGATATLIEMINRSTTPVLAIDQPSGLDATTGEVYESVVLADCTLTLALPKTGFRDPAAVEVLGDLWVADIGVPTLAFEQAGLTVAHQWTRDLERLNP